MLRIFTFVSILSCILGGCARYCATSLLPPPPVVLHNEPTKNGLRIYAKAFSEHECKKFLDRNILAKGYQPIQLYIENHSHKTYLLSKNNISLPLVDPKEVAQKVHTSTIARATGYGAAAILICPLFAIPAVVDSLNSEKANESLDSDYFTKTIKDQVLFPYSQNNMILFVLREAFHHSFTVTLIDDKTKSPQQLLVHTVCD